MNYAIYDVTDKSRRISNKILKDTYLYYGVSEEDIRTESQRYKDLLIQLSM